MGPNTDWRSSKQAACSEEALKSAGKDEIMYDETKAVADSLADGSVQPLKNLVTGAPGSTALEGTGAIAGHVAGSRSAQLGIKHVLNDAGVRETGAAIGKTAARVGKFTEVLGWAVTAYDGYKSYNSCMQQ